MKTIPLTRGYVAIVDEDDHDRIAQHKWTAIVTGKYIKRVYAYRRTGWDNANRRWENTVWMHREISAPPIEMDVDHVNYDTLDNRKENLRHATRSENLAHNRRRIGQCGYRGVTRTASGEKAPYKTQFRGKCIGKFFDVIEAARAYDAAAAQAFGKFACLNFPDQIPESPGVVGPQT